MNVPFIKNLRKNKVNNQQIAQKVMEEFLWEPRFSKRDEKSALVRALKKLRKLISGTNENVDWRDECNVSYVNGYDDCLHEIDKIVEELEQL